MAACEFFTASHVFHAYFSLKNLDTIAPSQNLNILQYTVKCLFLYFGCSMYKGRSSTHFPAVMCNQCCKKQCEIILFILLQGKDPLAIEDCIFLADGVLM